MPLPTYAAGTLPSSAQWTDVAWNGTVFCAIATAIGGTKAATSNDGLTWTAQTLPAGQWKAIAWNGTVFVVVGNSVAATSPDGVTWTTRTIGAFSWQDIAWNGTVFCAFAAAKITTSPDGITWTAQSDRPAFAYSGGEIAALASGRLCIIDEQSGSAGSARRVSVSTNNGVSFTTSAMLGDDTKLSYGLATDGTQFVTVRYGENVAETSPDGVTWTARTLPSVKNWYKLAWDATQATFVAIANAQTATATSPDGITWTAGNALPSAADWQSVTANSLGFVLVAGGPSASAASSCPGFVPPPPASAFWTNFVRTHEVP